MTKSSLRSLTLALMALSVSASMGCGGNKEISPLEQWKQQAGERSRGVLIVYPTASDASQAPIADQLPASHLILDLDGAALTARYGYREGELDEGVALSDPKLLSTVSSARGILVRGSLPCSEPPAVSAANLRLALRARHSAGTPIAVPSTISGVPLPGAPRHSAELNKPFDQAFGTPDVDLWPEGLVVWSKDAPRFTRLIDDLAKADRPFVVLQDPDSAVVIDSAGNRLSTRGWSATTLLDFTDAKLSRKNRQVENVRLSILRPGDAFDLGERRVRFAAGKSIHGSTKRLPMEKYDKVTDPDTILEMAARLADSAPGSTLAADLGPDGTLILTRDAETLAFRPLAKGEGNPGAKLDIKVGLETPWTISRLRLDMMPAR